MNRAALICVILAIACGPGRAQDSRPAWTRLDLDLPEGMEVRRATLPGPVRAFAAFVPLHRPEYELRPMHSTHRDGKEPLSAMATSQKALLAINTSFFNMDVRPCPVLGWIVIDGREVFPPVLSVQRKSSWFRVSRSALWWGDDEKPRIDWITRVGDDTWSLTTPLPGVETETRTSPPERATKLGRVRAAIGAGPRLLRDGVPTITRQPERMFESEDVRHPRTAVGLTADDRIVLVVLDGRCPESVGMTLVELAGLMATLGARDAMNMDGGGSSTLVVHGKVVNDPLGKGVQRPVPTALGVFRRR